MRSEEINWLEDPFESTSYDATVKEEQKFVAEALSGLHSQWGEADTFVRDKAVLDQWWTIEEKETKTGDEDEAADLTSTFEIKYIEKLSKSYPRIL